MRGILSLTTETLTPPGELIQGDPVPWRLGERAVREKSPWQRLGELGLLLFHSSQLKGNLQGPYYAPRPALRVLRAGLGLGRWEVICPPPCKALSLQSLTRPRAQQAWPQNPACTRRSVHACQIEVKGT